jgi:hypothetical protein
MIWEQFLAFYPVFIGIILAWIFTGGAGGQRAARVVSDGRMEFAPGKLAFWAWPPGEVYLLWIAVKACIDGQDDPLQFLTAACFGGFAVYLLFAFPKTIIATGDGLQQVYWLRRRKRIPWKDIAEINTGGKSRTVTIRGADGTKIVHSSLLADRPRLLLELKQHCGEELPEDFPVESAGGL